MVSPPGITSSGTRNSHEEWNSIGKNHLMEADSDRHDKLLLSILLGVPQGSILGPILFCIYINDLPNASRLIALLFADDTTLYMSDSNFERLVANVNKELKKVTDFFREHKLSLHPEKTKYMIFSNSNEIRSSKIEIKLDFNNDSDFPKNLQLVSDLKGVTINDDIPAIKFLGVFIDPLLNFKYHVNTIDTKLSKALYFLRTLKNVVTTEALKATYYALFHSHLIYAIQIWGCTNFSNLKRIVTKQKMTIRIINNEKYNAHSEPLFKVSKILPLNFLIDFFNAQVMYRYTNDLLPASFRNTWPTNQMRRGIEDHHVLRNANKIFVQHNRLCFTDRFPLTNVPKIWNSLPNDVTITDVSPLTFKLRLKEHFLSLLSATVNCSRLLCPSCHLGFL
jgi:Reverse transcriptase (RNA-dependent DNA polymerase)